MTTKGDGKIDKLDLEKGPAMDPLPGKSKDKTLSNKEEVVISYLRKLLVHFGLYEFFAEQASPENQWEETEKIWIVAIAILSCNTAVITTMPATTDGALAQAVLILTTLSFVLAFILVITPIAMPTLHMPNIKRFVLVSAGIVTACSYLTYVATKMGGITPTSIAAIFASGLFVSLITVIFLIQLILASRPLAQPECSAADCRSSLPSAPPTAGRMT